MTGPTGERLHKKVMVQFLHRAGKNGEILKMRSWVPGVLILSDQRIILAHGAHHENITVDSIFSLDPMVPFDHLEGLTDRALPIIHAAGQDLYLTLIASPPAVRHLIKWNILGSILSASELSLRIGNGRPVKARLRLDDDGVLVATRGRAPITFTVADIAHSEPGECPRSLAVRDLPGIGKLEIIGGKEGCRILASFAENARALNEDRPGPRHMSVLRTLEARPMDTAGIASSLVMDTSTASMVIHEMVFLGLIGLDHASQLYTLSPKGISALSCGVHA